MNNILLSNPSVYGVFTVMLAIVFLVSVLFILKRLERQK